MIELEFNFSPKSWECNNARLTNQIYKILPMYENDENWEKQTHSIILELKGFNELFYDEPKFMLLIAKLESLKFIESQSELRKIVFELISLLKEIKYES